MKQPPKRCEGAITQLRGRFGGLLSWVAIFTRTPVLINLHHEIPLSDGGVLRSVRTHSCITTAAWAICATVATILPTWSARYPSRATRPAGSSVRASSLRLILCTSLATRLIWRAASLVIFFDRRIARRVLMDMSTPLGAGDE